MREDLIGDDMEEVLEDEKGLEMVDVFRGEGLAIIKAMNESTSLDMDNDDTDRKIGELLSFIFALGSTDKIDRTTRRMITEYIVAQFNVKRYVEKSNDSEEADDATRH